MTSFWRLTIAITAGAALAQGCGGSSRAAGSVGAACLEGGVCDGTLVCLSQICVAPPEAGSGGATGSAGATGGGGAAGMDCTAASTTLAASSGLITDFMSLDGGGLPGGFDGGLGGSMVFAYPNGSITAPTFSTADGALQIMENNAQTSTPQYVGIALVFAGCIDAAAFTGVQFSIAGSFSGCTMQFATGDVEHQDPTTGSRYATGPTGAYPAQSTLTAAEVTSTPQTLMMPFTGSTLSGNPQTPLDPKKLILVLWQFTIPAKSTATSDGAPPACVADITVDNVAFY